MTGNRDYIRLAAGTVHANLLIVLIRLYVRNITGIKALD
jgi:hypothetical protein